MFRNLFLFVVLVSIPFFSAFGEEPVIQVIADQKDDVKVEEGVDDESAEKADDDAEEEADDDDSGNSEKKIAAKNDESEEEPCDCGTIAEGECAPCPDEE